MAARTGPADARLVVYGYDASVYVRSVRLALAAKGVTHDYRRTANFDGYRKLPVNDGLHPFGKVPVIDHGDMRLYETAAIHDYIEALHPEPPLVPRDPVAAARMRQLIAVYDNYCHGPWTAGIVTERLFPGPGATANETVVQGALGPAETALSTVGALLEARDGAPLDRADLHLAPAIHYFQATPEGAAMIANRPRITAWWDRISRLDAVGMLLTLPSP